MTDFDKLPPECDILCEWRECLHKGYNKGTYTPGRGYTSYYAKPEYVCMTRMAHGCPGRLKPDVRKILNTLGLEITAAKASIKVKKLMRKMYTIIKTLEDI